jgi:hypothetical protein
VSDLNFRADYPDAQRIEVMTTIPSVRWRKPLLELGVNLLNFSDPRSIRRAISQEVKGFIDL